VNTPEQPDSATGAGDGPDVPAAEQLSERDAALGPPNFEGWVADTMNGTLDLLERVGDRDQPTRWVPTGFEDLDDLLGGGMWPGHLVVIGGRAGMGTSTLAMDLVRSAAVYNGIQTLLVCPDTSINELNLRLIAATGKIPVNHMRNGVMREENWDAVAKVMEKVTSAPLRLNTNPYLTVDALADAVAEAVAHGTRLVVLDGIQSLVPVSPRDTRYHELCEQVHGIKRLARAHNIPIVVTSKLNRLSESRVDKRPLLHDLRNAGDIEDVADVVILLHRDDMYEAESTRPGEADLVVAKHRHGPTRSLVLAFQGHYGRFVDIGPQYRR
jgi:replicative DNA helicase